MKFFIGAVIIAILLSACSITINNGSEGQPGTVIYQNSDGKME